MTLALLHVEYLEKCPDGYRYTQFCELYRTWLGRRGLTMRLDHRAGDKAFVDYSGVKLHIVDRSTGEVTRVDVLVLDDWGMAPGCRDGGRRNDARPEMVAICEHTEVAMKVDIQAEVAAKSLDHLKHARTHCR